MCSPVLISTVCLCRSTYVICVVVQTVLLRLIYSARQDYRIFNFTCIYKRVVFLLGEFVQIVLTYE